MNAPSGDAVRLTQEEVQAAIVAKIDENGDGIVDYPPDAAAYWTLAVMYDLGLLPDGTLRRPWERS